MARSLVDRSKPADVADATWNAVLGALSSIGEDGTGLVIVLGRGSVAESAEVVTQAAEILADAYPAARFLPALRRGNVMGALDMGLAPGMLPGRVSLEAGREWYGSEGGWTSVPAARGRDTAGVLAGLADGSMKAVVLLGADPIGDFPDLELATKALEGAELVIAVDCVRSPSVDRAHVVLPAAMHHERPGTTTNIEGRVLRVGQKLTPPSMCWPDWMIAVELAARLGSDLGVGSQAQLSDEIERLAPSHAGLTRDVLDSPAARDGIVVPIKATPVVLGRPAGGGARGARSAGTNAAPFDPIATPGIESVELQGAVARVGFAEQQGGSDESGDGRQASGTTERVQKPPLIARQIAHFSDGSVAQVAGALRLVSPRRLYDHGMQMLESPALAALVEPLVAKVNPSELEARNIAPGSVVRLASEGSNGSGGASLELAVVGDAGVPAGVVEVSANVRADGGETAGAARLIRSGGMVVDLQMEQV
jgi:NADH-quinone oxidoreductase subunit G